jgi:aquaporin Z
MTVAPHRLDESYPAGVLVENRRTLDRCLVEAVGTFGLVLTVGVAMCSRTPFAATAVGAVLMLLIYAGGYRVGAHLNPAVTLAAALWGRIPLSEAAASWLAQLAAGACAAMVTRLTVGALQAEGVTDMMLGGRPLVAAYGATLMFAFVLAYVKFSCAEPRRNAPNSVWHLVIAIGVLASTVDFAALFGGVYLISQVIASAFTAIAFVTFGSAAR